MIKHETRNGMINPLRAWRAAAGLTRPEAATALEISYTHLAHLESNYNPLLSLRVLDGLAALGVDAGAFRELWRIYFDVQNKRKAKAARAGISPEGTATKGA